MAKMGIMTRKLFIESTDLKSKLWLCLPAITANLFDALLTLLGQPAEYWGGTYRQVNEFNPMAHWALTTHPLAFLGYVICELMFCSIVIILLPLSASKVFSVAWTIGSAKAIYNWLAWEFSMGWWVSNLALFIPAIVLVYAFEKSYRILKFSVTKNENGAL
jgi:hypothetical protein